MTTTMSLLTWLITSLISYRRLNWYLHGNCISWRCCRRAIPLHRES